MALLYDEYKRQYPETIDSIREEIETLYEELYGTYLLNSEEITTIFIAMGDDRCRCAHEDGIRAGVQLALDLELDPMMGDAWRVSDR